MNSWQFTLDIFDLNIRLVQRTAAADRELSLADHLLDEWEETDSPSIDLRMVDRHATFFYQFIDVAVARQINRVLSNADQGEFDRKTFSLKIKRAVLPKFRCCSLPEAAAASPIQQSPSNHNG